MEQKAFKEFNYYPVKYYKVSKDEIKKYELKDK